MTDYLYLIINLASISIPFLYSFERKMYFIGQWKSVFLAIFLVAVPFIIWDIAFTKAGVWGFNPTYYLDLTFYGLPIEELLFFICIPYASLFTHYAYIHFFENRFLSEKVVRVVTIVLILAAAFVIILAYPKLYTSINLAIFVVLLLYALKTKTNHLAYFYITFLVVLIPFFVVNGILTGSFIKDEVVWYNPEEFMGVRLFTVPAEDMVYAFNLLYLNLILIEKFKGKKGKILKEKME